MRGRRRDWAILGVFSVYNMTLFLRTSTNLSLKKELVGKISDSLSHAHLSTNPLMIMKDLMHSA